MIWMKMVYISEKIVFYWRILLYFFRIVFMEMSVSVSGLCCGLLDIELLGVGK